MLFPALPLPSMVKLNTGLKVFALFEFAQTETARMRTNRKNISNDSDYLFVSIHSGFGNAFFLASQGDELGDVLGRGIVPCQGCSHDQDAV